MKGKTFADYIHDHSAGHAGNVLKPRNPERFIMMSAGPDGLYGTTDDVNNFQSGL